MLETVIDITRFQSGVSWHFRSLKDQVLKIDLLSWVCENDWLSLAKIKIKGPVAFSPSAHTNLTLFAKISPFSNIQEGW